MRRLVGALGLAIAVAGIVFGCGDDQPDLFVVHYDAGADAAEAGVDAEPAFDPTLGGPCSEDAQCDDQLACTFDRCDKALMRCRNTPDDTQCDDGTYCNGKEKCVLRQGCAPGPVTTCQDDNPCTIDRCTEESKTCAHAPRDVDGDGDPDGHCVGMADCDDTDPQVNSKHSEVCDNGKDDNCNGAVDEKPCAVAANDTCASALEVTATGTYLLSTVAAKPDYAATCSVATPSAARDIVVKVTVPPGGDAKDILVTAAAHDPVNEVAVAMQKTCGDAATEIECENVAGIPDARAIARSVPAGESRYAIVTTQAESALDVRVELLPASAKPTNEDCTAPMPVAIEASFTSRIIDASKDLSSDCDRAKTGELTYSFVLSQPQDVRIFASTISGSGQPALTIRDPSACTVERDCRVGATPPIFARSLPAGTHVFSVAGTSQIDESVIVKTYPPTTSPPNETCATAPALAGNSSISIDLSSQEDAIKNGCLPGGPSAAYRLDLANASDVLVIGRFAQNERGAVSINRAGCTTSDVIACTVAQTPVRLSRRNLAAGSYWIVVADELGQSAQLDVLVRDTVAPTLVTGSDDCTTATTIPDEGGFFTGDNTNAKADFDAACDSPGVPIGGARDRILKLTLTQQRRVVFDMEGSFYTTLLDIRQGATCPGAEVADGCYVGLSASRSFLDMRLDPGTYWVQVDGYAGDTGAWNLDVRTLAP